MHPHPGFPNLARVDDFCGLCSQSFDADLPAPGSAADLALHAKEEKARLREARQQEAQQPNASNFRRAAAIAAVALIAAAAFRWRRGG